MPSLRTAANRMARHYQRLMSVLNSQYRAGGTRSEIALLLFDVERQSILQAQAEVERLTPRDRDTAILCAAFARDAAALINLRFHPRERIRWIEAGIQAAEQVCADPFKARMWNDLGQCYAALGDSGRATQCYQQALDLSKDSDEGPLVAALGNLANLHLLDGKPDDAIELLHQVIEVYRARTDDRAVGIALNSLGAAYKTKADYARSIDCLQQSLALHQKIEDRQGEARALVNLGVSHRKSGHPLLAIEHYQQALPLLRAFRDERGEADALWNLSLSLYETGEAAKAIQCARSALAIRERLEDPHAAKVRRRLAIWEAATG